MMKVSAALAVAGLVLLLASAFVPTSAALPAPVPTPTLDLIAQGRALFVAKGCVSCHRHAAVPGSGPFGSDTPDLSAPRSDTEFLWRWLADPAAMRPGTWMPQLNLSDADIAALIAFLNQGRS